jgi:hypothetical protein
MLSNTYARPLDVGSISGTFLFAPVDYRLSMTYPEELVYLPNNGKEASSIVLYSTR